MISFSDIYFESAALCRQMLREANDLRNFAHEQMGLWRTIGGHPEGEKKHVGGTHVKIDENSGQITAGPKALEGKIVDELKNTARRPSTYFHGDRAEYTGKTDKGLYEIEMMEGHERGQKGPQ